MKIVEYIIESFQTPRYQQTQLQQTACGMTFFIIIVLTILVIAICSVIKERVNDKRRKKNISK